MNILLSPSPIAFDRGVATVRILVGLLLTYHGHEVFRPDIMQSYVEWDKFAYSFGAFMAYAGKSAELISGICLVLGLFTRFACILIVCTFSYITFIMGNGKVWYEDQHPFMFIVVASLFFFTGPGVWNLDIRIFGTKRVEQ